MPAVAVLGAVAIAALVVLMVFAVLPLSQVLRGVLQLLPFGIGSWVVTRQLDLVAAIYGALASWAGNASVPAADAVRRITWYQWRLHDLAASVGLEAYNMGARIVTATIPRYFNAAVAYAQQLHAQAIAYAQALHAQAIAYAQAVGARDITYAQAVGARGIAYAQAVGAQALQYTQAVGARDIAYTQAVGTQAIGYTRQAVAEVLDYERQLYGQATGYARQLAAQDQDYARALAAAVGAAAAASTAAVATRVGEIEDSACQRFCGPLGDLGGLLQQLEDAGLVALLLGLAAESLHDPTGTARTVTGLVRAPATQAADLVAQEIGVGRTA